MIIDTADENRRVDALTGSQPQLLDMLVSNPGDLAALRKAWSAMDSIPVVLKSREEGEDHSWMGLDIRTLLRAEHSSGRFSCHDVVLAPGARLPLHFLEAGDTYWSVIDGPVDITIGDLTDRIATGGFAYAPALTRQGVSNPGPHPVRLFLSYRPAGADRAFADAHAHWVATKDGDEAAYFAILARYGFCFDTTRPLENDKRTNQRPPMMDHEINTFDDLLAMRERWFEKPAYPKLIGPHPERNAHNYLGIGGGADSDVVLIGDEGSGSNVVFRGNVSPGFVAGNHHQPSEEELFYVLEGSLTLTCGSVTDVLGKGAFGFAPRNATHGFKNGGAEMVKMITMNSPAGHERGFQMMMREGHSERLPELMHAHGWRLH